MRFIKLGGKRGGVAMVDDEDFDRLNQYSWSMDYHGYPQRRCIVGGNASVIQMHRDILDAPAGMVRDHIDGNPLNNVRANLRICENRENCANRKASTRNTSGYKGVSLSKKARKFRAFIKVNYRQIGLGCYNTPEEAAAAYNFAAIDYFGEFARLNILPDGITFTREYLAEQRREYIERRQSPDYREAIRQKVTERWQARKRDGYKCL